MQKLYMTSIRENITMINILLAAQYFVRPDILHFYFFLKKPSVLISFKYLVIKFLNQYIGTF